MGYYAAGGGEIKLKQVELPLLVMTRLNDTFEYKVYNDNPETILIDYDNKYHEDSVIETLDALTPYVESGCIQFTGEDGGRWRFRFINGEWVEENGKITWSREQKFSDEDKKRIISELIDVFYSFSDGKPSDITVEDATNAKLSRRLEDTLMKWCIF